MYVLCIFILHTCIIWFYRVSFLSDLYTYIYVHIHVCMHVCIYMHIYVMYIHIVYMYNMVLSGLVLI